MVKQALVFFGFNGMRIHKRGVENVIHFQALASPFNINYYIHWDAKTYVYRYESLLCIGIQKNAYWLVTLNVILYKLKKRNKIFIHSHNPLMSIVSLYRSNLFTIHDGLYYLATATKHRLSKVFWLLENLLYLRCNYIHFISDFTKKMSLYKRDDNFIIIYNTSHFEHFKGGEIITDNDFRKFNSNSIKIFSVRSIEERALINLIIEVATKLKNDKFEFFIAGKGPLLSVYRDEIKSRELKNISLLGYVSDNNLRQYYADSDLVIVTAAYGEGFGLPIIEGYLFDKPVIASNICAIPEVIFSKEYLFENTIESIMSKIDFVIKQNSILYRKYYNERFSNEVVLLQIKKLYEKLL